MSLLFPFLPFSLSIYIFLSAHSFYGTPGKTHIANRICRFLSFFHDIPAQIFNVGDYRRELCGAQQPAEFYDPSNSEARASRFNACNAALEDLIKYMSHDSVRVAAFDATNTTRERRQHIREVLIKRLGVVKMMFIESICTQEDILEQNIRTVKVGTPDYRNVPLEEAVDDFKRRRGFYEAVYEPLEECDGSHLKIINSRKFIGTYVGCLFVCASACVYVAIVLECLLKKKMHLPTVNNIRGYLPLKVVHFVMNLHTMPRTFYLTRHGQSEYNLLGKIGGDSGLTPAGVEYARRLADFAKNHIGMQTKDRSKVNPNEEILLSSSSVDSHKDHDKPNMGRSTTLQAALEAAGESERSYDDDNSNKDEATETVRVARPARLWTSTLRRTKETAQFIEHPSISYTWDNGETGQWYQFRSMARRNLDELYAGVCDGMTYKEIEQVFPEEFKRRQDDKLSYRYPRGESYMDVTLRLEPLAQELERTREPVLIVGHQGILRILYAYFMGLKRAEAPYVNIPLNNVIELKPHAYGCNEERFCLMRKEEMLNDGQDEPVTSMPVKSSTDGDGESMKSKHHRVRSTTDVYHPQDPVMNAPSC